MKMVHVTTPSRFDCNGDPIELDDCDPLCLVIDESLQDYTVQCLDDLAAIECLEDASVYNACTGVTTEATSCVTLPAMDSLISGEANTALGVGPTVRCASTAFKCKASPPPTIL